MNGQWTGEVIRFWFEEIAPERWFRHDEKLDTLIRERFSPLIAEVAALAPGDLDSPEACLAGVIVLDQFPRNVYRNSPRVFENDAKALAHSQDGIDRGFDRRLPAQKRMFLYMPWQHAEDPAAQAFSVELFEQLGVDEATKFAREHKRIIDLFGRFPHRNAALGRTSTPQEVEFMKTHPGF